MSEPSIIDLLDVFYYRQNKSLTIVDQFFPIEDLEFRFFELFGEMDGSALSDRVENTDVGSKRFLRRLIENECFERKVIPFAEPVFRYLPEQFKTHRATFLNSSAIHQQSAGFPSYFNRAFEGYLASLEAAGEPAKGSVIPRDELAVVDWNEVASAHNLQSIRSIKSKIVELATAVQQAEIDDRLRTNLLARVRAVDALLESDDPPWEIIVDLLNYRYLTAFLSAFTIIQIILGLGK